MAGHGNTVKQSRGHLHEGKDGAALRCHRSGHSELYLSGGGHCWVTDEDSAGGLKAPVSYNI